MSRRTLFKEDKGEKEEVPFQKGTVLTTLRDGFCLPLEAVLGRSELIVRCLSLGLSAADLLSLNLSSFINLTFFAYSLPSAPTLLIAPLQASTLRDAYLVWSSKEPTLSSTFLPVSLFWTPKSQSFHSTFDRLRLSPLCRAIAAPPPSPKEQPHSERS